MASMKFKFAVNNAKFPFLYSQAARSVVNAGQDVAPRTNAAFVGTQDAYDYNTIQMLFCENALPTIAGVVSCGFREVGAAGPAADFDQLLQLRTSAGRTDLFCPARGKNYVFDETTATWTSYSAFTWASDKVLVSTAYVDGRTFVCYERDRIVEFVASSPAVNTITLTYPSGYSIADIRGVCGVSNYLVAHTTTEILWSSLVDVTDLATVADGAGRQTPIDLKGPITCTVPIAGGFLICTTKNIVAAFATNDAARPFTYREVAGSAGVLTPEQITKESTETDWFAYGSSGLQTVNLQQAQTVFADCTDFLANRSYDLWDTVTGQVVEYSQASALDVKLQLLSNRFLVISCVKIGAEYQLALVYDVGLRRWGKLRHPHVDVGTNPNPGGAAHDLVYDELVQPYDAYNVVYDDLRTAYGNFLPARAGFLFLRASGQLDTLLTDLTDAGTAGVVLFGRVQNRRSRTVTFVGATLEGLYSSPAPTVRLSGSLPGNGFDRDTVVSVTASSVSSRMAQYAGRSTFENFDLAIEGKFGLSTGLLETMDHGSR